MLLLILIQNLLLNFLRYEDMLSAPENTFAPLATFLGFDTPPERLVRAIRYTSFAALAAAEEKSTRTGCSGLPRRMFRGGKSDQWREVLSADQVRRVVDRHAEQMQRFGYIPDSY